MSTLVSLVGDVEDAVASGDARRRTEALRRITSLFLQQAPHLKDAHVAVFDEVILRLARDLEFRARLELAEQLADIGNAPVGVVRELASDRDATIAGPMLERSPRLTEDDLVQIAGERGQEHLLALSRRSSLSERVTDILVDRGDTRVVRSVASNDGARFSSHGFEQLMDRARGDATLQAALRRRADLPPETLATLVTLAGEKVRETLQAEIGPGAEAAIKAAVAEAAADVAVRSIEGQLYIDYAGALERVQELARRGNLSEETVTQLLRDRKIEDALAAMALIGRLPIDVVARAYHSANYDPLLFIVRSLRFGWATLKLFLTEKAGRPPPESVMKSAIESFQQLSVPTAKRVVHFTIVRERAAQGALSQGDAA
jgi:uncharacterized protein (DUF2336 family)